MAHFENCSPIFQARRWQSILISFQSIIFLLWSLRLKVIFKFLIFEGYFVTCSTLWNSSIRSLILSWKFDISHTIVYFCPIFPPEITIIDEFELQCYRLSSLAQPVSLSLIHFACKCGGWGRKRERKGERLFKSWSFSWIRNDDDNNRNILTIFYSLLVYLEESCKPGIITYFLMINQCNYDYP